MFSLNSITELYNQFLSNFPPQSHGFISLALAVLLVFGIYKVLKRQFIFLILLVILLPASIPILKNVWNSVLDILQFLITQGR